MSTLNPKTRCVIVRRSSNFDQYGRPSSVVKKKTTRCAVVKAGQMAEKTTVRNDSAASGGAFEEINYDARILFLPNEDVKIGDLVEVLGLVFEIKGTMLRPDVNGKPHHIQTECDKWGSV